MLTFSSIPTADLAVADRVEALELARSGGGSGAAEYLEHRFERYATLHLARGERGLSALMLSDRAAWNGVELCYIGPVFSRRRAYLPLFSDFVLRLCDARTPFIVCAEVESALVRRDMRRLLPRWIQPKAPSGAVSQSLRAAATAFAAAFPHIEDLELEGLTSRRREAFGFGRTQPASARYQLLLLPCFGDCFFPRELRKDLTHDESGKHDDRDHAATVFCAG